MLAGAEVGRSEIAVAQFCEAEVRVIEDGACKVRVGKIPMSSFDGLGHYGPLDFCTHSETKGAYNTDE